VRALMAAPKAAFGSFEWKSGCHCRGRGGIGRHWRPTHGPPPPPLSGWPRYQWGPRCVCRAGMAGAAHPSLPALRLELRFYYALTAESVQRPWGRMAWACRHCGANLDWGDVLAHFLAAYSGDVQKASSSASAYGWSENTPVHFVRSVIVQPANGPQFVQCPKCKQSEPLGETTLRGEHGQPERPP
jgi:hypothetical protein